jgi:hypothetical protein
MEEMWIVWVSVGVMFVTVGLCWMQFRPHKTVKRADDDGCRENKTLESVTIAEGVEKIEDEAFYGCENLKTATIPSSVTEIGERAFVGCCPEVIINRNPVPQKVGETAFSRYDAFLYVPAGSVEAYKADKIWGKFKVAGIGEAAPSEE